MNDHRSELDGLLADRAAGELNPQELARLAALRERLPDVDADEFDRLVGEITAALTSSHDAMPLELRERIARRGQKIASERPTPDIVHGNSPLGTGQLPADRQGASWFAWSGWAVAAAVAALWIGGVGQPPAPDGPTLAELRQQLIEGTADAIEVDWSTTEDPAATDASGDVVWSNSTQSGMMRFVGLQPNDPSQLRYQLWIFDGARDDRYPIDGGLFDVQPGATEVLVPVDARLQVTDPTLFAVTVERSGGVVVSDRGRIVVVAPIADVSQAGQ